MQHQQDTNCLQQEKNTVKAVIDCSYALKLIYKSIFADRSNSENSDAEMGG